MKRYTIDEIMHHTEGLWWAFETGKLWQGYNKVKVQLDCIRDWWSARK